MNESRNTRTDRVNDRQDGRNQRLVTCNRTARKYSDKYWNGNGYYWSGEYDGGW